MKINKFCSLVVTFLCVIALNGCGGGGGGGGAAPIGFKTVTGPVAVGAPVSGGKVSLLSSIGELVGTGTTTATGSYSVNYLANKTGPFLVEITGGTFIDAVTGVTKAAPTLHSVADATGIASITPLSEMVIAMLFAPSMTPGQTLANVFANCQAAGLSGTGVATACTPYFAALAPANVTTAQNALITALGNLITAVGGGITDVMHQASVVGLPMDLLLDATKPTVSVTNNVAILTLNMTGGPYSFGVTTNAAVPPLSTGVTAPGGVVAITNFAASVATTQAQIAAFAPTLATAASELVQIQTQLNSLASLSASGPPALAAVTAKLSPAFLMDGMDAATYARQLTTAPSPMVAGDYFVASLTTVFDNVTQSNQVAGTRWVNATHYNAAGAILGESRVKFVNTGGSWLMAGNERAIQVSLRAESGMASLGVTPTSFTSDVNIAVDPTTAALKGITYAYVTGPSVVSPTVAGLLPGVLVYKNPTTPGTAASAVQTPVIPLCDAIVIANCTKAVDGAEYTITLINAQGVQVTYKEALVKAPLPASALNAAIFPVIGLIQIGAIQPATIAGVAPGAVMSVSWTNPQGLVSNWADFAVWDTNGQLVFQLSGTPVSSAAGNSFSGTSPAFTLAAGVALARFNTSVQAADVYGRQYIVFR